ncbi:hypothetical protein DSCW_12840 [Desulfosarcina widdelii]|uniref:Portal protein n=1 Tax=Desulfosarcina widdelii TaxID=947919 RepID=A0A5K7ZC07_9BACT|nr:hypothetical protein [Desulfosarcina widdelii]BBO73867.1 hypothetical protein DSCW_12840 [Desulfosarcina widdelii]
MVRKILPRILPLYFFCDSALKITIYGSTLVKKVINNLAAVYGMPAIRNVEGTKQDQAIFQEISTSAGLPVKLKAASRYTKLLKTILIRPVWRNGKMDMDVLTGDILDVTTGDCPEDLRSVLITHYPESGKQDEVEFSYWTGEVFQRLDYQGNVILEEPNPYHVVPYVPCWDRCPLNDFWLAGGDDLINIQEAINEKLTDLLYVIRMQGFGVGWIRKKNQAGGQIGVNPGTLVELPEDGALGFESQQAPIKEILEAISFLITQAAVSNGLSVSTLSTKVVRESGLAKVQGQRELEELRRDDIILWKRYEEQLFQMIRTVWNVHNPARKIIASAVLKTDFSDPKPEISAKDQAETWEKEIGLGVISPIDVVMMKNQDLRTREEAATWLEKIKAENAKFRNTETSPTQT